MKSMETSSKYLIPVSSLMSKIARFLAVFYLMSLIPSEEFAKWILISLILQYSLFLQLGVPTPTSRELSISYGKGNFNEISYLSSASLQVFFIASFLLLLLINLFYQGPYSLKVFYFVTFSHASALLVMQARSTFRNYRVILSYLMEFFIIMIGLFFMDKNNPIENLINIYIIAAIASCLICLPHLTVLRQVFELGIFFNKKLKRLIIYAFPLLIFSFLMLFRGTWDILYVNSLRLEDSSIYISSNILGDCIRIIATLISMVFLPYLAKIFGEFNEKISKSLLKELRRYELFTLFISIFILLTLYPLLYFASNIFYPEYVSSINLFFLRTSAILFGIMSIPRLLFLNTIRKPIISNLIVVLSILAGIFMMFIIKDFLSIYYSMTLSIFFSNTICLIFVITYSKYFIIGKEYE